MAQPWSANIEQETKENKNFRTVLWTGEHSQLTVMSIDPGAEIGWEVHNENDQFLRVEEGEGRAQTGSGKGQIDEEHYVPEDWAVIIPAGTWHNVVNSGSQPLKLYSIYSPAEHPPNTVHKTKAEADAAEAAEHG